MWCFPCLTLQLLPAAADLKCVFEVSRRLREATLAEFPCGPGQSKCSSLAFPPPGLGLGENCITPHASLFSFYPLPQSLSEDSKCPEGCGTRQIQESRVALDS